MSRIGKKPVPIPKGVKVHQDGQKVTIEGPKGKLAREFRPEIEIIVGREDIKVVPRNEARKTKALFGLTRTLLNNMILGVSQGFTKELEIVGVGYKVELRPKALFFTLGYSHPIYFELPETVTAEVDTKANRIKLFSSDKELLGLTAAKIRSFRKPEPYKGKGIKMVDEVIRRKVGKSA